MSYQTFDLGEEYIIKTLIQDTIFIGLYNEADDSLGEGADLPVPSEPDDGNYQRLEYSPATTPAVAQQNDSGDWEVYFPEQRFELTNTTGGYVDSIFTITPFQAEGESGANDHLWYNAPITNSQGDQDRIDLKGSTGYDFSGMYSVVEP